MTQGKSLASVDGTFRWDCRGVISRHGVSFQSVSVAVAVGEMMMRLDLELHPEMHLGQQHSAAV